MRSSVFKSKITVFLIIFAVFIVAMVAYSSMSGKKIASITKVLLITTMGNITIELFDDMPTTSGNFGDLTQNGVYDGTLFHRVAQNPAVVQGGDARPKGLTVPAIPDELPNKHSNVRGSVAMAKTNEPNSATSQFYINYEDNLYLDDGYTVFGEVVAGMSVVDAIANVETDSNEKPLQDVTLISAELVE